MVTASPLANGDSEENPDVNDFESPPKGTSKRKKQSKRGQKPLPTAAEDVKSDLGGSEKPVTTLTVPVSEQSIATTPTRQSKRALTNADKRESAAGKNADKEESEEHDGGVTYVTIKDNETPRQVSLLTGVCQLLRPV